MSVKLRVCSIVVAALLLSGCATSFSPESVRGEIVRQSGQAPVSALEIDLGRFTTLMLRNALARSSGELPFTGLSSLQLAVYEVPRGEGPVIDATRIPVRGWEEVLKTFSPNRSAMVLMQPRATSVGDLVVLGSGPRKVIYARLTGVLDESLPASLGRVIQQDGPDALQDMLTRLAEQ